MQLQEAQARINISSNQPSMIIRENGMRPSDAEPDKYVPPPSKIIEVDPNLSNKEKLDFIKQQKKLKEDQLLKEEMERKLREAQARERSRIELESANMIAQEREKQAIMLREQQRIDQMKRQAKLEGNEAMEKARIAEQGLLLKKE